MDFYVSESLENAGRTNTIERMAPFWVLPPCAVATRCCRARFLVLARARAMSLPVTVPVGPVSAPVLPRGPVPSSDLKRPWRRRHSAPVVACRPSLATNGGALLWTGVVTPSPTLRGLTPVIGGIDPPRPRPAR